MIHAKFRKAPTCQWWAAAIGAGAALLGSKMNNDQSAKNAAGTTEFNAEQAQMNRDWQERMANSSYQRAVGDMKSAGLNPMLAYSQGGAPTPSGSTASGVMPTLENEGAAAVSGAVQAQQARNAQLQQEAIKAQTDLTRAQRDKTAQEAINAVGEGMRISAVTDRERAAAENLKISSAQIFESIRTTRTQGDVNEATVQEKIQAIKESYAREDLTKVNKVLAEASIAEAKVMEDFFKSQIGSDNPFVQRILDVLRVIISAKGASK